MTINKKIFLAIKNHHNSTDALTELSAQFTLSFASLADSLDVDVVKVAELGNAILYAVHDMLITYLPDKLSLTKRR